MDIRAFHSRWSRPYNQLSVTLPSTIQRSLRRPSFTNPSRSSNRAGRVGRIDVGLDPVEPHVLEGEVHEGSQGLVHVALSPGAPAECVSDLGATGLLMDREESAGSDESAVLPLLQTQSTRHCKRHRGRPRHSCAADGTDPGPNQTGYIAVSSAEGP